MSGVCFHSVGDTEYPVELHKRIPAYIFALHSLSDNDRTRVWYRATRRQRPDLFFLIDCMYGGIVYMSIHPSSKLAKP